MSKPSLYQVTSRKVDPLSDLMKAVAEVNWHRVAADAAGWIVDLSVTEGGALQVQATCSDWPSPEDEATDV